MFTVDFGLFMGFVDQKKKKSKQKQHCSRAATVDHAALYWMKYDPGQSSLWNRPMSSKAHHEPKRCTVIDNTWKRISLVEKVIMTTIILPFPTSIVSEQLQYGILITSTLPGMFLHMCTIASSCSMTSQPFFCLFVVVFSVCVFVGGCLCDVVIPFKWMSSLCCFTQHCCL